MNKSLVLTVIVTIAVVTLGINAYADDTAGQMSALQQKAESIQSQMNEAGKQCGASLDKQMKSLTASIENLVKQRVLLGAQISQLEGQVEELKGNAKASCGRQMKQYEDELASLKQQMASLAAQKADPKTKTAPAQAGPTPPRSH
jgi:chromosome segregation ATPase